MATRRPRATMEPLSPSEDRCSVLRSLDVFGDVWSLGVIRSVAFGYRRFGEFRAELGVASNILADRLARLVAAGVLERVAYQERPIRHEYRLTEAGMELVPLVLVLKAWGDRHLQPRGAVTLQRHRGCTLPLALEVRCPDCGAHVSAPDIETIAHPQPALNSNRLPHREPTAQSAT